MADIGTAPSSAELRELPLDNIQPRPENARKYFDPIALQELADSIRSQGVIQPIVVQMLGAKDFEIIAGERRWRAARMAALETIPCMVYEGLTEDGAEVIHLSENLQRKDLSFAEAAAGTARLVKLIANRLTVTPDPDGLSALDVAAKETGQSKAWVSRHASVGNLDMKVQELVGEGSVTSVDIAHDLHKLKLLNLKEFDTMVGRFIMPEDDGEDEAESLWEERHRERVRPTRADIRLAIQEAEDKIKRQAESKAKQKAEREKLKAANGGKVPVKKPKEDPRAIRSKKIGELKADAEKLQNAIHASLCTLTGSKSKNGWGTDIQVTADLPNVYGSEAIPKTAASAKFRIWLRGSVDAINAGLQVLAPGGKVDLRDPPSFTVAEARKIEAALGRALDWGADDAFTLTGQQVKGKIDGTKAPLSFWPAEGEPSKAAAQTTAAKKGVSKPAAKKAAPAKPKAAAKKAPAKKK